MKCIIEIGWEEGECNQWYWWEYKTLISERILTKEELSKAVKHFEFDSRGGYETSLPLIVTVDKRIVDYFKKEFNLDVIVVKERQRIDRK